MTAWMNVSFPRGECHTHEEVHVEEKVYVQRPEVEEVGDESPNLPLAYQRPAEEELRPRGCVQLAHGLRDRQNSKPDPNCIRKGGN